MISRGSRTFCEGEKADTNAILSRGQMGGIEIKSFTLVLNLSSSETELQVFFFYKKNHQRGT